MKPMLRGSCENWWIQNLMTERANQIKKLPKDEHAKPAKSTIAVL